MAIVCYFHDKMIVFLQEHYTNPARTIDGINSVIYQAGPHLIELVLPF